MLQTLSSNVAGCFLVFVSVLFTDCYKKNPRGQDAHRDDKDIENETNLVLLSHGRRSYAKLLLECLGKIG
jgi:hypothetical protein